MVVQAGMASPGGGVAVAAEVTLSGHTREEKSLYVAARAALGSEGGLLKRVIRNINQSGDTFGLKWHLFMGPYATFLSSQKQTETNKVIRQNKIEF